MAEPFVPVDGYTTPVPPGTPRPRALTIAAVALLVCAVGAVADTALLYLLHRLGYEHGKGYIGNIHLTQLSDLVAPAIVDTLTLAGCAVAVPLLLRSRPAGRVLALLVSFGNLPVRGLCCFAVGTYASQSGVSEVQPVADYSRVWVVAGAVAAFAGSVVAIAALLSVARRPLGHLEHG